MGDRVLAPAIIVALAIVTASCGSADQVQNTERGTGAEKVELVLTKGQHDGIRYVADFTKQQQAIATSLLQVKKIMDKYLFDPSSAKYSALQIGRNGSVCGQYNAKNRYNAYVGFKDFVITSDGRLYTSDGNEGIEGSLTPSYVQAYLISCATKAQIAAYKQSNEMPSYAPSNDDFSANPDEDTTPGEQEPDRILDAPPARKRPATQVEIPTA